MDKALIVRVGKQAWFHRYPRGWPMLLFVIVALGTLLAVVAIERAENERRQLELDRNVTEIASGLQRRASENIAILRAAAAIFSASNTISVRDFGGIAAGLHGDSDYHGSAGLGWAPWLAASDVQRFEANMARAGQPGFRVHPVPPARQDAVVPIAYLEPRESANMKVVGFDMYSEATRREAMDAALVTEQPVASGKVHLMQDIDRTGVAGFLIYMPVFRWEAGRRSLRGFVYSPFRAEDFLDSAAELVRNRGMEVAIYDQARRPERLLAWRQLAGENEISIDRQIVVANRSWIVRASTKESGALTTLSRVTLVFGAVLAVLSMAIARLITKRAAEDRAVLEWLSGQSAIRTSLTRELNHRVKNTLANVLSIVALTRRRSADLDDFAESLTGRIRALSATHDLLSQSDWTNAPIAEIVRSELAPYMAESESHVEMSGIDISLMPNDALSLGLAIHELATNAAKYGALSVSTGRVFITWELVTPEIAEVRWREAGGPPVVAPTKRGFGRDLLEKIVAHELQSAVELEFNPEGVECKLRVPVRELGSFSLRSRR